MRGLRHQTRSVTARVDGDRQQPDVRVADPANLLVKLRHDVVADRADQRTCGRVDVITKRRVWCKTDLGIDERTLKIRAVEFTSSDVGDAPMLPELLAQIPTDQEISGITADGVYDTRKCRDPIAKRGAAAVIPPRHGKPIA